MKTRGLWFRSIFSLAAVASCCWTTFSWATKAGEKSSFQPIEDERSFAELFEPSEEIAVIGSSQFPKPTRKIDDNATVIIEPTLGKHRPDEDAILAYAEGYHLSNYMMFMESLQSTGYTGDVVFSIAEERIIREHVMDYLTGFTKGDKNKPNLVIYQVPLDCDGEEGNKRRISRTGDTDGFQMCRLSNIYGWKDAEGNVIGTAPDPRKGRVVATLRYEWYWIWSLMYNPHSWLMLIDARDSFFQTNPFIGLPRETDPNRPDGLLYLFGENPEATRLGISKKNKQWISNAYGAAAIEALKDKPTICSGSTMGEQIAIETYLRAMVNEHDECSIKMMGSDQGFHNYLYYSKKLSQAETIRRIIVWEQGKGAINNLGALRTKPFSEWGFYDEETLEVWQWDGKSLSPVVHQYDRDKHLNTAMNRKMRQWSQEFAAKSTH